ncbi:purine permease 21-like isoform X5 [Abrus precatorius]|uniref:Probable purine permease n=1 Tax=Abrus precatorius TaxID=3816 RepID=A0A8B8KE46_ABRPR|nr:purine permease 21-like isoform X5 [Abrus precatorius]
MGKTQEVQLHSKTYFTTINMGEPQQVPLSKNEANGAKETNSLEEDSSFPGSMNQSTINKKKRYYRWLRIAIHAALVLVCSSAAVLLGRLYYEKGGKSKWMGTLVQLAGFPILLPYYFFSASKNLSTNSIHQNQPSTTMLAFIYVSIDSNQVSKKKYVIGFICTIGASAGYGLWLSLTQLVFKKVLKRETFKVVMDMIIYQSLVATCVTLVGLFASGEWSGLKNEMKEYEMGKASYLLNLTFTAILWQLFTIGCVGLIFEVSSLFSNAISVLGVPVVPMLAVMFFDDKMHGVKAMSMVLAIWGFVSYVYQQYLDDTKSENRNPSHVPKASSPLEEEVNR